jgi:hypothetical protein
MLSPSAKAPCIPGHWARYPPSFGSITNERYTAFVSPIAAPPSLLVIPASPVRQIYDTASLFLPLGTSGEFIGGAAGRHLDHGGEEVARIEHFEKYQLRRIALPPPGIERDDHPEIPVLPVDVVKYINFRFCASPKEIRAAELQRSEVRATELQSHRGEPQSCRTTDDSDC